MAQGSATLTHLTQRINRLRANAHGLNRELQTLSGRLNELRAEQAGKYGALARMRLDEIRAEAFSGRLNNAETEARSLLAERESTLSQVIAKLEAAERLQEEIEAEREAQALAVESADQALTDQVDVSDQALEADGQAMKVRKAAEQAIKRAEAANEKARQAREDRVEKGKPYEADPLFMYLWKRKFGLSEYRAGNLTRTLDAWVARLVDYHKARPNYAMLLEIPERLAEHAEHLKNEAESQVDVFEQLREARYEADGVMRLEAELNQARDSLARTDERLADQEKLVSALGQERMSYADGEDHYTQKALSAIVNQLRGEDFDALRRQAAATPSPEDDALTANLQRLDGEVEGLTETLNKQREAHHQVQGRLTELEDLRRKYRHRNFADPHSRIRSGSKVDSAMERYLLGAITAAELWRIIQQQQYFKRTKTRHNWPGGWGGGSGGGGIGRGGFGGGGFSSGGGFGGGGFSTGGGF